MQMYNPLNPPAPLPPVVMSSYSTLIPGPFILLLLLRSIPLLLFSIGARPPDTSALPFSMTEVFTTAAFVSIAGGVVIGLVVWPDMGKNIGNWVSGESKGFEWSSLAGASKNFMSQRSSAGGQVQIQDVAQKVAKRSEYSL